MALEEVFTLKGATCQLQLQREGLRWTTDKSSRLVPIVEVVGCWQCAVGDAKCWTNSIKSSKGRKPERIQPLASTSTSQDTFVSLQSNSPDTESPNTNILESPSPSISSQGICTSTTVESDQNATHDRSTEDTVQSSNNRDTKLKSSKLSFKSNNYKTFTLGESLEVSGIEGECCHTSEGRMSSPMLCVEYCERVLPSSSFSCYSIDPDAIIGPWRTRILVLHHNSIAVTVQWCVAIRDAINHLNSRPRHLAVIINPHGGGKQAMNIYKTKVVSLLSKAAIATTVLMTTVSEPGEEQGRAAASMPGVDGVVVMGGDGLLSRVVMGIIQHQAKVDGISLIDSKTPFPKPSIRIGIIPVGTSNCTVKSVYGTGSVTTALLHIIMGESCNLDVAGAYDSSGLVHISTNSAAMGTLGNTNTRMDALRFLPPKPRIFIAGTVEFLRNKHYPASIKALVPSHPTATPHDSAICTAECAVCSSGGDPASEASWEQMEGTYGSVMCLLVSARGCSTKYGFTPAAHLADGCCDLILIPRLNIFSLFIKLYKIAATKHNLNDEAMVVKRCCEVSVTAPHHVPWALDGEIYHATQFTIRVHRKIIQIFGRGIELVSSVQ